MKKHFSMVTAGAANLCIPTEDGRNEYFKGSNVKDNTNITGNKIKRILVPTVLGGNAEIGRSRGHLGKTTATSAG